MEATNHNEEKPNLKPRLFWEWRYEDIDWQEMALSVIERVLVWGIGGAAKGSSTPLPEAGDG